MKNFILKENENMKIVGYKWDLQAPEKIVCVIHGIGEYSLRYKEIAEKLNKANISLFAIDLRGHGKSSGVRGHTAGRKEILKDIDDLILYVKKNYPDVKIVLYGHSMGGNIVLDYRNRGYFNGEISGYIITSPWIKLAKKVGNIQYFGIKMLSKIHPKFQVKSSINPKDLGNIEKVKNYTKDSLMHGYITAQCALEGFEIGNALYDDTHEIKGEGRKKPLLLMHGDKDRICSVEGSIKIAENQRESCKYIQWKNMLHELHNGNEENDGSAVIETIIEYLKTL